MSPTKKKASTPRVSAKVAALQKAEHALRAAALAYPGATEEFPWGERAIKVAKKIFVSMSLRDGQLGVGMKLPRSHEAALMLPFASPMGYGLAKSGWVSTRFDGKQSVPLALLLEWMDESYRAIAPKALTRKLLTDFQRG